MSNTETIHEIVKSRYGAVAISGDISLEENEPGSCCTPAQLYPTEMLAAIPMGAANISLGCGNPIDGANLQPGETVIDLGSGGGIDCFFAAQHVGQSGRVIGIDMTDDMLAKARTNLASLQNKDGPLDYSNVEFRRGNIEALPVEDTSVDVIISNCVINLAPDKQPVFQEMWRVLKPGGRIRVSDMVTQGEMAASVREDENAWVSCIAGALPAEVFRAGLEGVGFEDVHIGPEEGLDVAPLDLPEGLPYSAVITAHKPTV